MGIRPPFTSFYTLVSAQHTCGFHRGRETGTSGVALHRGTGANGRKGVGVIDDDDCDAGPGDCQWLGQAVRGGTPSDLPPSMPMEVPVIMAD